MSTVPGRRNASPLPLHHTIGCGYLSRSVPSIAGCDDLAIVMCQKQTALLDFSFLPPPKWQAVARLQYPVNLDGRCTALFGRQRHCGKSNYHIAYVIGNVPINFSHQLILDDLVCAVAKQLISGKYWTLIDRVRQKVTRPDCENVGKILCQICVTG